MTGDIALGAALGAALFGGLAGEWVRRRPVPTPAHVAHAEILAVLVTTSIGALFGGCSANVVFGDVTPASALTPEAWTPCEPPRPGLSCWRSGHAVVCEPETP